VTTIAVSGKGGVGKTLVATMIVKNLVENKKGSVLAIDADPDSNLAESLGVKFDKTVGDIREEITEKKVPPGVDRVKYLDGKLFEITVEAKGFDLLVMGRPEGPGCYCAVNHMLREIVDKVSKSYNFAVIDAEAGLEHLSRRTTQNVDTMLIVTDSSRKGFQTATRIRELARELDIKFDRVFLVLNRVSAKNQKEMRKLGAETGLKVITEIPEDEQVKDFDLKGKALMKLPADSPVYASILDIVKGVVS